MKIGGVGWDGVNCAKFIIKCSCALCYCVNNIGSGSAAASGRDIVLGQCFKSVGSGNGGHGHHFGDGFVWACCTLTVVGTANCSEQIVIAGWNVIGVQGEECGTVMRLGL
jgi:hypothetical protein